MKPPALLWLLLATSACAADGTTGEAASANAHLASRIQLAFPYTPPSAPSPVAADTPGVSDAIVVLPLLTVTASSRGIDRALEEQKKKSEAFTWKDGGSILKKVGKRVTSELKFKYNPDHGLIDILSFSW